MATFASAAAFFFASAFAHLSSASFFFAAASSFFLSASAAFIAFSYFRFCSAAADARDFCAVDALMCPGAAPAVPNKDVGVNAGESEPTMVGVMASAAKSRERK